VLKAANEAYATDYPAAVGPHMSNTDSGPFQDVAPAISVREAERGSEIGGGWDPHGHTPSDVFTTYNDADFRLGLNAAQTTLSAVAQLTALSGRVIVFHTAVALVDAATGAGETRLVDVRSAFRALSPAAIEHYLQRERPYDCAGAVKSEALGIALFDRIESDDPTALIGLPLIALTDMLRAHGVDVLAASLD